MNTLCTYIAEQTVIAAGSQLTGGVHWGSYLPGSGVWKDYIVLTDAAAELFDESTGPVDLEKSVIQFTIFGNGLAAVNSYLTAVYVKFRHVSVELSDVRVLDAVRLVKHTYLDEDAWSDGTEIWVGVMQIEFATQRIM